MFNNKMRTGFKRNGVKKRYLFLVLLIILNGFIFSQRGIEFHLAFSDRLDSSVIRAAISPDGNYFLAASSGNILTLYKTSGGKKWTRLIKSKINGIDFNRSGNRILVSTKKGILASDTAKGNFSFINKKIKKVNLICSSPGKPLFAASKKKDWIVGDQKTGFILNHIKGAHKKSIKFIDFISEERLITVGGDHIIKIWDFNSGREVMNNKIYPANIQAADLSFDKKFLLIGTYEFKIDKFTLKSSIPRQSDLKKRFKLKIVDTQNLSIIKEIDGTTDYIIDLSISADNKFAAVLKDDNTVDVWGLENGYIIRSFSGQYAYHDITFGPLGESFILSVDSGQIQRWNTRGIVVATSGPQYIGDKYKINTPTFPIITRGHSGITIAILDFSGLLIDPQVAEAISSFFRNRISNYSYINVVERDEMNKILNEQGLQNSGVTSPEKAAEIGKVLNAQKLIMGKISALGSTLITTTKVVDVESAKIEGGREIECQNYALENLPEMVGILLNVLIEK